MSLPHARSSSVRWPAGRLLAVGRRLAAVVVLAGAAWVAWQVQPFLAVAAMLGRMEAGTLRADDLDAAALTEDLTAGIDALLRTEAAQRRRDGERLVALRGLVAGLHAAVGVPALLAESLAPEPAAAVKRTQRALRPPPLADEADPRPLAVAAARRLATPAGLAALGHAAMARAPADWPSGGYDRLAFVQPRLTRPDADSLQLALKPSGLAPFWQTRLTVLTFRREGLLSWRLAGVRLAPASAHARAVLDAAAARLDGQNR